MTSEKQKRLFSRARADKIILILVSALLIGLFIKNAADAAEYVRQSLSLCVRTVIPSIFPSTVLSGIFVSLGGGKLLGELLERPMRFLFGISGAGASVLFLGWFCGFPVGAITGAAMVRLGELDSDELSRLMLFSNIPSPAFVISAVGETMLGNKECGFFLYLILLFCAALTGVIQNIFTKKKAHAQRKLSPVQEKGNSIANSLCSSAVSMLNLCANIVFFSVLTNLILSLLSFSSPLFSAILCGIFELSGGCAAAAALDISSALPVCAFILGWSGFGVHFQIISACGELKKLPLYFAVKLFQGLACAAITLVLPITV